MTFNILMVFKLQKILNLEVLNILYLVKDNQKIIKISAYHKTTPELKVKNFD
jgi:hypothetical protein